MRHSSAARQEWSTPASLAACGWLLTAGAALWWVSVHSATDRVFVGAVVAALAAVSCYATVPRPRLRADADGITVRSLGGTRTRPWQRVRVDVGRSNRFGRTVEVLELDIQRDTAVPGDEGDESELIVLTKLDLGQDTAEVAEQLHGIRP